MRRKVQVRRVRKHMNGADLPQGKQESQPERITLPEPCAMKVARTVPRGGENRKAIPLPSWLLATTTTSDHGRSLHAVTER